MDANVQELDLNQVRTFVRIVQLGSFTKAAEYLRQPKSRVSRRLSSLEGALGVQLIYRTTRQFQLTEMGRFYYQKCQGLIEGLESVTAEMTEANSEVSGLIKITASDDMGTRHLGPILDEFMRLYPRVRFEVFLTQAFVDLVKESIDVAVRIGPMKDSSLRARKVASMKAILVAAPGFVERYRPQEGFEDFAKLPFLSLGQPGKIMIYKGIEGKTKLALKPQSVFSSNNPAMLLEMTLLGRGIGFIPEFLCIDHIKAGRLVHLFPQWRGVEIPLNLVTPEQKEISLKVKKFMEFATKRLRDIFEHPGT